MAVSGMSGSGSTLRKDVQKSELSCIQVSKFDHSLNPQSKQKLSNKDTSPNNCTTKDGTKNSAEPPHSPITDQGIYEEDSKLLISIRALLAQFDQRQSDRQSNSIV